MSAKRPFQFTTGHIGPVNFPRPGEKPQAIYSAHSSRRSFATAEARDRALARFLEEEPDETSRRVYVTWNSDNNWEGRRYFLFNGTEVDINGYPLEDQRSAYLREASRPIADQLADEKAAIVRVKAAAVARDNARFDREFDGRPRPFVPDVSDLEAGECDTCGEVVEDFNAHNRVAYRRHLEITGELHVLDCYVCGKPTDPDVDEFVPGRGWRHVEIRA
jgi:hypothetical protein